MLSRTRPFAALLLTLLAAACSDDAPKRSDRICATCRPTVGGETTSFAQASLGPCYNIYKSTKLSAAQARAEGFAVDETRTRLEHEFDAPLKWRASPSEFGEPATGYDAETQIHVRTRVLEYVASHPDPARCQGEPCTFEGDTCVDSLRVTLRVEVSTRDGALTGSFDGSTLIVRDQPEFNKDLGVDAKADLTSLSGRMQLHPTLPKPHFGEFWVEFPADHSWGALWAIVAPAQYQSDDSGLPTDFVISEKVSYQPLRGSWGKSFDGQAAMVVPAARSGSAGAE